jgi:nucleoside transporter
MSAPTLSTPIRLSVMMFLQYAIWGAWLPFLWSFLAGHRHMEADQIGSMFAAGAVGAIFGPFIAGQIADRWLATEKLLAIQHFLGACLIWQLAKIENYDTFLWFSVAYGFMYAPTMALTNSLAFHHLVDRDREFGRVRLWGTFGWIVVGLAMGQWLLHAHAEDVVAGKADAFRLSAILGFAMSAYCLTLPHTPPSRGKQRFATWEALREIAKQPLVTLFLITVPVSCIHQFYFVHTESFLGTRQAEAPAFMQAVFGAGGGGLMTIGQMSEVLVLGAITLFAKRFSRKTLLAVGLLAYAARMALFAYVDVLPFPPMLTLVAGLLLHGPIFGCFIFLAFMIVDEETTADVRASAQSLYNLVIVGVGVIVGSLLAGEVAKWAKLPDSDGGGLDYARLFSVPMWASIVCFSLLIAFYPYQAPASERAGTR